MKHLILTCTEVYLIQYCDNVWQWHLSDRLLSPGTLISAISTPDNNDFKYIIVPSVLLVSFRWELNVSWWMSLKHVITTLYQYTSVQVRIKCFMMNVTDTRYHNIVSVHLGTGENSMFHDECHWNTLSQHCISTPRYRWELNVKHLILTCTDVYWTNVVITCVSDIHHETFNSHLYWGLLDTMLW
jgi:hypothetical protein